jgi:hypothetical protein
VWRGVYPREDRVEGMKRLSNRASSIVSVFTEGVVVVVK